MNRRVFLTRGMPGLALGGLLLPTGSLREAPSKGTWPAAPRSRPPAGGSRRRLRIPATLQTDAFASSSGDDARYHALVYEGGGAAGKALFTTPISDREVARLLREMGAEDGGGVPMAAWNLRRIPLVRAPTSRVAGSPVHILVDWEGWDAPRELSALLQDSGRRGVAFRFGGNEEHDHLWESGCVACLFSCPGGVVSNERYTIRDHVRGATRFSPVADLPRDGTEVTVEIERVG